MTGFVEGSFCVTYGARVAPNTVTHPMGSSFSIALPVPCIVLSLPEKAILITKEILNCFSARKANAMPSTLGEPSDWLNLASTAFKFWDNPEDSIWDNV